MPCGWDGTVAGFRDGIDSDDRGCLRRAVRPVCVQLRCALAAEIRPRFEGPGLAKRVLDTVAEIARDAGLTHLIAPVRPSSTDREPITPIEQYVTWTREDAPRLTPFPAGLAPLEIDHAKDEGPRWEPNVWIVHDLCP